MIGTRLLHYQIQKKLGSGGMGEVYLAQDTDLGRQVALKILSPERFSDPDSRRRFLHEAKAQAMLSHPNVATFHEVKEHGNMAFIVMEYVEGDPLSRVMQAEELARDEILDIAIQMVDGVRAAHEHGVIHRDIKPDNIMITPDRRVKITDFGLARWKGASTLTKKGTRLGSAFYMSPEQADTRRVDARSDIFSIGVILYELFCRRRPFEGDSEAVVLYNLVNDQPQPMARYCKYCPESVEWIVMKCLHKDPAERYQSAADLVADLKHARHELDSEQEPSYPGHLSPDPRRKKNRTGVAVTVLALALVLPTLLIPSSRKAVVRGLEKWLRGSEMHVVVIPFTMVGEQPEDQAMLDGLMETVTSKLTQMKQFQQSLRIVPASDVRMLDIHSVREARRAFGATHVITGSMQDLDDRMRVTMNLVDARKEVQLRSSVIDQSLREDISGFQDTTVLVLATMVDLELLPKQLKSLVAGKATVGDAYEAYLKGKGYLRRHIEGYGIYTRKDALQLDSAVVALESAVKLDTQFAQASAALGSAIWHRFRLTQDSAWLEPAMSHTLRAIELDDEVLSAYMTRGSIHSETGRYLEAIHEYKQVLKLDALNLDANRAIALSYEKLNRPEDAERTYRYIIELKPDELMGYYYLELFYLDMGRYDDARALVESMNDIEPEGYDSWNRLGNIYGAIYYKLGEWDKAREVWERSLTYGSSYAALSNLGTIHYMQSRYEQAAQIYEQALKLDDSDYRIWINLASAPEQLPDQQEEVGRSYQRALELAERVRIVNPKDAILLARMAECYAIIEDTSRALGVATRALELAPENIEVIVRAGLVHEQLGERDSALDLIGKALAMGFPRAQLEAQPERTDLLADPRLEMKNE
jgi:serine/threonine protein kinase/tetratricopeptide (TPR) repeat protein